jgi:hypothetical protein
VRQKRKIGELTLILRSQTCHSSHQALFVTQVSQIERKSMTLLSKSIVNLSLATLAAVSFTSHALAQGSPAMPGPTGAPKVTPSIVVPGNTPPIGGPVVLQTPTTTPPPVPRGAREALQGQATREVGPRLGNVVPRCQLTKPRDFPGVIRSFASIQGAIEGNLREDINSKLTITGTATCFGTTAPVLGGLRVRLVRGDGREEPFFRPLGRLGNSDLVVRTWSSTKIEFTVPPLLSPTSLPLVGADTLRLDLITSYGVYRTILTQADINKLDRDGNLTFSPSP